MTHKEYLELLISPLANEGGGGGTPAVLIDKNISANGTYNAVNDSADGYKTVVVDVQPDLQAKSVTITENGETTVAPDQGKDGLSGVAITVNVQSGGGNTAAMILNKSITGVFRDTEVTQIPDNGLSRQTGMTALELPNCASVGANGLFDCSALKDVILNNCTSFTSPTFDGNNNQVLAIERLILPKLVTMNWGYGTMPKLKELYLPLLESMGDNNIQAKSGTTTRNTTLLTAELPSIKTIGQYNFQNCYMLQALKFGPAITAIGAAVGRYTNSLRAVIFDKDTPAVPSLGSDTTCFTGSNTKFYVPDALVDTWKGTTNWTVHANRIFALSTIAAWAAGTYAKWDVVTHSGMYWISQADSNTEEPGPTATNWLYVGAV